MKLDVDVGDNHKPKYIPLHGKERFNADLRKEPVGWLHILVTTPEEYCGPRRIVYKGQLLQGKESWSTTVDKATEIKHKLHKEDVPSKGPEFWRGNWEEVHRKQ